MAGGGGKGGSKQQTVQVVDPQTRAFTEDFLRPLARQAAGAALDPTNQQVAGLTEAQQTALGQLTGLGSQLTDQLGAFQTQLGQFTSQPAPGFGFSPQAFDPSQTQGFLNPFLSAIDDQALFDANVASDAADQALTAQNAFGGSRTEIARAAARDHALRRAGQQRLAAFDSAQRNALQAHGVDTNAALQAAIARQQGQLAARGQNLQGLGLGLQGVLGGAGLQSNLANQLFQLGDLERQIQQQRFDAPLRGFGTALGFGTSGLGPFGQTTTQTGGGTNALGQAAGGALTGFGVGGPIGGAIGGGLGLLGGLFG